MSREKILNDFASNAQGSSYYTEKAVFAILHEKKDALGEFFPSIVNAPAHAIDAPFILRPDTEVGKQERLQLSTYLTRKFADEGNAYKAETFIINTDVGNSHWAALIVQKDRDNPRNVNYAYVDSKSSREESRSVPDWLKRELGKVSVNGQEITPTRITVKHDVQQVGVNCGDHAAINALIAAPILREVNGRDGNFFDPATIMKFEQDLAANSGVHAETNKRRDEFIKPEGAFYQYEQFLDRNHIAVRQTEEEDRKKTVAEGQEYTLALQKAVRDQKVLLDNAPVSEGLKHKLSELYESKEYLKDAGGRTRDDQRRLEKDKFVENFINFYREPTALNNEGNLKHNPLHAVPKDDREDFVTSMQNLIANLSPDVRKNRGGLPAIEIPSIGHQLTVDTEAVTKTSSASPRSPSTPTPRPSPNADIDNAAAEREAFNKAAADAEQAKKDFADRNGHMNKLQIEEEIAKMNDEAREYRCQRRTGPFSDPLVDKLIIEQDAQATYNQRIQMAATPYAGIGVEANWVGVGDVGFQVTKTPVEGTPAAILGLQKDDLIVSARNDKSVDVHAGERDGQALLKAIHGEEGKEIKSLIVQRQTADGLITIDLVQEAKAKALVNGEEINLDRQMISPKSLTVFQGYHKEFELTHKVAYDKIREMVNDSSDENRNLQAQVFNAVYKDGNKDYSFDKLEIPLQNIVKKLQRVYDKSDQSTKDEAVKAVVRDVRHATKVEGLKAGKLQGSGQGL